MNNTLLFPNFGILTRKVPADIMARIITEVNSIQQNFSIATPHNDKLAGNIRREFTFDKCYDDINPLVMDMVAEYDQAYNYLQSFNVLTESVPLVMMDPWVNFMLKHEFNPPHNHSGVLSYVIWVKVPYTNEAELLSSPGKDSIESLSGKFSFHFNNIIGQAQSYHLPVDKTYEGIIMMFPAALFHSVNPFYSSDEYRVSVAGNVKFKT